MSASLYFAAEGTKGLFKDDGNAASSGKNTSKSETDLD
jgi:hypothetical protein